MGRNADDRGAWSAEFADLDAGSRTAVPVQGPAIRGHHQENLVPRDVEVIPPDMSRQERGQVSVPQVETGLEEVPGAGKLLPR